MNRLSVIGAAAIHAAGFAPAFAQINDGTVEDEITFIVAGESGFGGAWLHLPGQGTAIDTEGIYVEGLLVGFVGDYVPFLHGTAEITLSEYEHPCSQETAVLVLEVQSGAVDVVDKRLRSSCREVVAWPDPLVSLIEGPQPYWLIELTDPETRPVDGGGVAPAMFGPVQHVRVSFVSEPPGSEIWVNDERLDYRTDVRLSIPYMDDMEDEKRWLIRAEGLVNCYGLFALPRQDVSVNCRHRDVR